MSLIEVAVPRKDKIQIEYALHTHTPYKLSFTARTVDHPSRLGLSPLQHCIASGVVPLLDIMGEGHITLPRLVWVKSIILAAVGNATTLEASQGHSGVMDG